MKNTYDYLNDIKKQKDWLVEQRQEIHQLKETNKMPKGEFKFQQPKTIEDQLDELSVACKFGHYDRKIIIKGFKGTFKLEHWKMIELRLRAKNSINSIKFTDTKLEKENLMILPIWFGWIKPIDLVIELQQNELDDQDVEKFIWRIFEKEINLSKLFIISNPGIYKGFLLRKLKHYLREKYEKNLVYHYLLIKNKQKHSIAIIKIEKKWQVQRVIDEKEEAKKKIDQTFYFDFTLSNCFTHENWKGFEHLVKCTYNEDNLEQISHLDISNNYLGTQSSFNSACQKLAGAKGLISLKIRNQPLLNIIAIQQLIGDRYDKFRVNQLDISDNPQLEEKAFQLLAENIFPECKLINLNNSLPEDISTLYKLAMFTQSYQQKNETYDNLQEKHRKLAQFGKYELKHNLQTFDMSKVENFNRYDQIENFLNTMIFSKRSNIQKYTIQNLDVGRTEALSRALNQFITEYKESKRTNQHFQEFKLSLRKLKMLEQTYNMKIDVFKQFFLDFLFTQDNSVLEIDRFTFVKCFLKNNRKEGLKEAAAHILEAVHKNPMLKFSIKCIKFFSANMEIDLSTFKCFLLTSNIKLRTFKYFTDTMKGEGSMFLNQFDQFLLNQPDNFIHSLQVLKFHAVGGVQFDVGRLIKLLIYSPKLQLKQFEFYKVKLTKSQITLNELDQFISNNLQQQQILSLQTLKFGDLLGVCEEEFFKYIVLGRQIQLKELTLKSIDITLTTAYLKFLNQQLGNEKNNPLSRLKSLEIDSITISSRESWVRFSEIFIFIPSLESLKFISINLDENFSIGLGQCASYFLEQQKKKKLPQTQTQTELSFSQSCLNKLSFIECSCNSDFLSLFFPICQIEQLEFVKCNNLQNSLQYVKFNYENKNLDEINYFALKSFTLKDNSIQDLNLFDWMVSVLIFHSKRQQLYTLNLINCNLNDDLVAILIKQIQSILQTANMKKRIFSLRQINFSQNNQISEQYWVNIFQTILNQNLTLQPELLFQESTAQDDINIIVADTIKYIDSTFLSLREKIICNPVLFKPCFQIQLKTLELDLLFEKVKDIQTKKQLYQRIITGLIIQPNSCLKHLVFSNLDLDLFMSCSKNSIQFSEQYSQNFNNPNQAMEIKLESIHIKSLTQQNRDSIEQFFNIYLCNQNINLKKLSLHGFRNEFLQILLKQSDNRKDYILEKLSLDDSEDKLNEMQTFQFVEFFILGKVFPLQSITLSKGIVFESMKQIDNGLSVSSKLKSISASIEERTKNHIMTYRKIFSLLLQNQSILENIEIRITNADSIFSYIYDTCKTEKLQLKSLILNGDIGVGLDFFQFIQKSVDTLKLLKIQKVIYQKQSSINYFLTQLYQYPKLNSVLDLNVIEHEDTYFVYYNLIFNDIFGFTNLVLRDLYSFKNLQISQNFIKLKYLKLDMGLNYDSDQQLDADALTLIAKKMIYNEESQLEEIIFMNCEFRVPSVKALVSPAANFRNRVNYSGRASQYYMNLKRFGILYSLHITQEGVDMLLKDLIYFEFVNIEKIELQAIDLDDKIVNDLVKYATDWLHYQKRHKRQFSKIFPLRHLDIGKNEQLQDKLAWQKLLRTLVFTEKAPYLEILNLHFMALDDTSSGYIAHQASRFLNSKEKKYRFPLKSLNFSKNNFLTEQGWKDIFQNFIFHPKVYLEELNLTSTQIDTDEKLRNIIDTAKKRALQSKEGKLPLHTFLCFNVALKSSLSIYLSNQPKKKALEAGQPKVNKWWKEGIFDEIPINFGDQVEILNNIIYTRKELIIPPKINYVDCLKFSKYHLSFVEHYLKITNELFSRNGEPIELFFNLSTLDKLSELFRYTTEKPAKPYPYCLIFQKEVYQFFKKASNNINKINIIQVDFPQLEEINQFDVLYIWENIMKNKINIDQIEMEYTLNDDLIESMLKLGYNERHIISLCRLIPPSKVRIQGSLSLQAIKGLYSILCDTYYFQFSVIDYKFDDFVNIGIGYGLREKAYQKAKGSILYNFCNAFVSPTSKYIFNDSVKKLNTYLSKQRWNFFIIAFTNLLFFGCTIVAPVFLIDFQEKENEELCQVTVGYQQYYCYVAFAFLSAMVEGYLYFSICNFIPEYIQQVESAVLYDETQITMSEYKQQTTSIDTQRKSLGNDNLVKDSFKERYKKKMEKSYKSLISKINRVGKSEFVKQINRFKSFGMSQLFKFDLFGDITFILVLQNCNYTALFYVAIAITAFTQGTHFCYFLYLIVKRIFRSDKTTQLISSSYINEFYSIGFQGRNAALSNLLDSIAPYNVSIIPNNQITRMLLPNQAGKSLSNLVKVMIFVIFKAYFMQFIFEDLPQIIIQTYFTVMQTWKFEGELEIYTYLRIAISLLTVISSFFKFMSIRPTFLVQDDFDKLSDLKKANYKKVKKELLDNERNQLKMFSKYGSGQIEI